MLSYGPLYAQVEDEVKKSQSDVNVIISRAENGPGLGHCAAARRRHRHLGGELERPARLAAAGAADASSRRPDPA